MLNFATRLALLAFGIWLISACGQKGPLYMPNNPPPTKAEKLCPTCAAIHADSKADAAATNDEKPGDSSEDLHDSQQESRETTPDEITE
ncbi:MAG: hypothetical protein D6160_07510 [Ketobacter sp.]|nr:MAG: hypothetical protein D6160_07510 [Ketobacter sp.]